MKRLLCGFCLGIVLLSFTIGRAADEESEPVQSQRSAEILTPPNMPIAGRTYASMAALDTQFVIWGGKRREKDTEVRLCDGAVFDGAAKQWRVLEPVAVKPRISPEIADDGRRIVLWGGSAPGSDTLLTDGVLYDALSGKGIAIPPAPITGRKRPALLLTADSLIVFGGFSDDRGYDEEIKSRGPGKPVMQWDGAVYRISTGEWQPLPAYPFPGGRRSPQIKILNHALFVWGGEQPGNFLLGAVFNATTSKWEPLTAEWVDNQNFYVYPVGDDLLIANSKCARRLKPGERTWAEVTPPPAKQVDILLRGRLANWSAPRPLHIMSHDLIALDLHSGTWSDLPDGPLSPRDWVAHASIVGGHLALWGGSLAVNQPQPVIHGDGAWLDIDARTWKEIPAAPINFGRTPAKSIQMHCGFNGRHLFVCGYVEMDLNISVFAGSVFDCHSGAWSDPAEFPFTISNPDSYAHIQLLRNRAGTLLLNPMEGRALYAQCASE